MHFVVWNNKGISRLKLFSLCLPLMLAAQSDAMDSLAPVGCDFRFEREQLNDYAKIKINGASPRCVTVDYKIASDYLAEGKKDRSIDRSIFNDPAFILDTPRAAFFICSTPNSFIIEFNKEPERGGARCCMHEIICASLIQSKTPPALKMPSFIRPLSEEFSVAFTGVLLQNVLFQSLENIKGLKQEEREALRKNASLSSSHRAVKPASIKSKYLAQYAIWNKRSESLLELYGLKAARLLPIFREQPGFWDDAGFFADVILSCVYKDRALYSNVKGILKAVSTPMPRVSIPLDARALVATNPHYRRALLIWATSSILNEYPATGHEFRTGLTSKMYFFEKLAKHVQTHSHIVATAALDMASQKASGKSVFVVKERAEITKESACWRIMNSILTGDSPILALDFQANSNFVFTVRIRKESFSWLEKLIDIRTGHETDTVRLPFKPYMFGYRIATLYPAEIVADVSAPSAALALTETQCAFNDLLCRILGWSFPVFPDIGRITQGLDKQIEAAYRSAQRDHEDAAVHLLAAALGGGVVRLSLSDG